MPGRFDHNYYGGGHPFFWGLLLMIGFAALAALVVYLVVRRSRPAAGGPVAPMMGRPAGIDPAVEAARVRYAQGHMTREQYQQIVADLTGRPFVDTTTAPPEPPAVPVTEPTPES
jgi:uncharacterized membrane protein